MPIYEYECQKCGHTLEALQKLSDKPLRECPECGKHQLKRLVSAPMFRLAGSGWYETDFKSDKERKRNIHEKGDKEPAPAAESKETAPAKTEAKADDGGAREVAYDGHQAGERAAGRKAEAGSEEVARPVARKSAEDPGPCRANSPPVAEPQDPKATQPGAQDPQLPDRRAPDLDPDHGHRLGGAVPVGHPGQSLLLLPPSWRPEALFGTYVPGVGVVLSLLLLLLTGVLVKNLFGGQMVAGLESLVRRIPVVGAVYGGAKTFSETVLTDKGKSFKQVVMVEFPAQGRIQHRLHHCRTSSRRPRPRPPRT